MEYIGMVVNAEEGSPPEILKKSGGYRHLKARTSAQFEVGDPVFKDANGIYRPENECPRCEGEMMPGDDAIICPHCQTRIEFEE